MGLVHKMHGLVMLMAAVSLFAASVSACACPTHAHAKPRPEKSSCHSHADGYASDRSNSLAADGTCSCGDAVESLAITSKPEKQFSPWDNAAESANAAFRHDAPRSRLTEFIQHPPPQLSSYNRLRFANLPSRAPPRLLS